MATALFIQGRIRGVDRPALGSIVPTQTGFAYFLTSVPTSTPNPSTWSSSQRWEPCTRARCWAAPNPRVGLLSNGEEEGKGNELVKETTRRLKGSMRWFVGNIEPKDIYAAKADVIVADGFVGNVAIKMAEATRRLPVSQSSRGDSQDDERQDRRHARQRRRAQAPRSHRFGGSSAVRPCWGSTAWPLWRTAFRRSCCKETPSGLAKEAVETSSSVRFGQRWASEEEWSDHVSW